MGTIATSIQIYDRASAPLGNIISAVDRVCSAFESIEGSMDGAFDRSKIDAIRQPLSAATQQIIQMGEEQDDYTNKVKQSSGAADGLLRKIGSLVATYATLQTLGKVVGLSDEMTQTNARLQMVTGSQEEALALQEQIYASAMRSRTGYMQTADTVAKLKLRTGELFDDSEAVAFAETVNKMFVIAGTSQEEMHSATLQMTQALGSGVLRGEEFNAVFESAPNIMQTVADYIGVDIGQMRNLAAEGKITSDILKNALLGSSEEITNQFNNMPYTWQQVWTMMKNVFIKNFQPVLDKISELANNPEVQNFAIGAVTAFSMMAVGLLNIIELAGSVASFFSDNWSWIAPIIMGIVGALALYAIGLGVVNTINGFHALSELTKAAALEFSKNKTFAATAAQTSYNAALLACPITWIVIAIIAAIVVIILLIHWIAKLVGSANSGIGIVVGALMSAVAFVWNLFLGILDLVLGVINHMWNWWVMFASFFGNLFNDPIASIIHLFGDLADNVLGILESIAKAMDKIFGSDMAGAVQGWRSGLDGLVEKAANKYGNGSYEKVAEEINLSSESLGMSRWAYGDAWDTGLAWGNGLSDGLSGLGEKITGGGGLGGLAEGLGGFDASNIPANIASTADNTGKAADSLEITKEDLKYLNDLAEREVVNRFTTAEIKLDITNHNNISSDMDLDGIVDHLANTLTEAMEKTAEGVYV